MKLSDYFGCEVKKDAYFTQTQFAGTGEANSVVFAHSLKYLKQALANENVSAIIVSSDLWGDREVGQKGIACVDDPEAAFYDLHNKLVCSGAIQSGFVSAISPEAYISDKAIVSKCCQIEAGVVIEEGAIVRDYSVLKKGVRIGPGAIVGADGHFFKRTATGLLNVRHAGGVLLERDVQVLAGAIVQKSLHEGYTSVGAESIVSVGARVGHGCQIGERVTITGGVVIAGYTQVGCDVWIGPNATLGNNLTICEGARIEIGSVVIQNVEANSSVSGNFALPHKKNLRDFLRRSK